jgi:hypothetical protein
MRIRLQGNQRDSWSRPEVYWAAVSIGQFDLNNLSWEQIKTRWANAIANAKTDAIPEYRVQLPAPGKVVPTPEQIEKHVKEMSERLGTEKRDYKAWARAIIENPKKYHSASLKSAQAALITDA